MRDNVIDLRAWPSVPKGYKVVEHRGKGLFTWDKKAQAQALYLHEEQENGRIWGGTLYEKVAEVRVLNASVLDLNLARPHLIPKEYEGKAVVFWGTVYQKEETDLLYVRNLSKSPLHGWMSSLVWIDSDFGPNMPAAIFPEPTNESVERLAAA